MFPEFEAASSEDKLVELYNENQIVDNLVRNLFGGVIFHPDFDFQGNGKVPNLDYKIRFGDLHTSSETNFVFPLISLPGPGPGEIFQLPGMLA